MTARLHYNIGWLRSHLIITSPRRLCGVQIWYPICGWDNYFYEPDSSSHIFVVHHPAPCSLRLLERRQHLWRNLAQPLNPDGIRRLAHPGCVFRY